MQTAPKNIITPVLVTRAGLDALPINASIDRWVAQLQKLFAADRNAALARIRELRGTHPNAYVLQERTSTASAMR